MARVKCEIVPYPLKQTIKRKVGYGGEDEGLSEASKRFKNLAMDDV
jgi:hypothetical protein